MFIVQITPLENGLHPFQSQSGRSSCWVDGYVEVPSAFEKELIDYKGFVDLTIEDGVVTAITGNEEAYQAYLDALPPPVEPEPTDTDVLNALLGVTV